MLTRVLYDKMKSFEHTPANPVLVTIKRLYSLQGLMRGCNEHMQNTDSCVQQACKQAVLQ